MIATSLALRCLSRRGGPGDADPWQSIGTVGDAYDNALMETVNGLFKAECIRTTIFHAGPCRIHAEVEFATAGWVDWYNCRRLHGSLGMLSPMEFETLHYEAFTREPAPAK